MKQYSITLAIIVSCLFLVPISAGAKIEVTDAADGSPISNASVFSQDGKCLCITDNDGILSLPAGFSGMVTVSHLNYESKIFRADTITGGRVYMSPRVYGLPETVLRYEKPDYLKLTAYVRSYNITDSVPASFADGLCDFYIPVGRGRMRRKVRAERNLINYAHPCKALSPSGLASALPRLRKPSLLKRLLHGGDTTDIIGRNIRSSGDFGAVIGVRSDTLNNTLEVYSDSLFTSDGPSGSLFGIRVRITYYAEGEMYSTAEGRLNYRNLLKAYNRSRIYVRTHGKHGPESMCDMFEEIYIVGVDYVRKEDLKSKNESKKRVQMKVPENIPPLSEPLQRAVEKMKG